MRKVRIQGLYDVAGHWLLTDLLMKLGKDSKIMWSPSGGHQVLSDGSRISIHGVGKAKLRLADLESEHSFQLVQIQRNIWLGTDFLKKQQSMSVVRRSAIEHKLIHI